MPVADPCLFRRRARVSAPAAAGLAGLLALELVLPGTAWAQAEDACRQNRDLAAKVEACTGLLTALDGSIGPNAWALVERANGWCRSGDVEAAVEDIWAWFEHDRAAIGLMQAELAALGFYAGPISGSYATGLDAAVIAWTEAGCPEAQ